MSRARRIRVAELLKVVLVNNGGASARNGADELVSIFAFEKGLLHHHECLLLQKKEEEDLLLYYTYYYYYYRTEQKKEEEDRFSLRRSIARPGLTV